MNDLIRRRDAVLATIAKFDGRPFAWGITDCMRVARYHLVAMGHRPPPLPPYRTALGAKRAATKAGGVEAVFDRLLMRIPAARMLPGDIAILEGTTNGQDRLDSVMICVGQKLMGFAADQDVIVNVTALEIKACWKA